MCYRPLCALYVGKGLPLKYIQKSTAESRSRLSNEAAIYRDKCGIYEAKMIEIPCGKCVSCKLSKSLDWTQRVMSEVNDDSYFVTFTYNDENLPKNDNYISTLLNIKDFSSFLKRMRSYLNYHYSGYYNPDKNICFRFFGCGEYGSLGRPHYHFIFFNLPIRSDLQPFFISDLGDQIYRSPILEKVWKYGYVTVARVTANDVAYVARYTLKKQGDICDKLGVVSPWVNMSRNPGIGKDFISHNYQSVYDYDKVNVRFNTKVVSIKPSKYYDKFYDSVNSAHLADIKLARSERAESVLIDKLNHTDLSLDELRIKEEQSKLNAINLLKRSLD